MNDKIEKMFLRKFANLCNRYWLKPSNPCRAIPKNTSFRSHLLQPTLFMELSAG